MSTMADAKATTCPLVATGARHQARAPSPLPVQSQPVPAGQGPDEEPDVEVEVPPREGDRCCQGQRVHTWNVESTAP